MNSLTSQVFGKAKKLAFIIPTVIIEFLTVLSMCAALNKWDSVLMAAAHALAIASMIIFIFRPASHICIKWLPVVLAQGAVLLDVFVLSGNERSRTFVDTLASAVGCVILLIILISAISKSKKLLTKRVGLWLSSIILAEVFILYSVNGTHFMKEDPVFVLLGHAAAATVLLLCFFKPKFNLAIKLSFVCLIPFIAFLLLEFLTHNPFYDTSFSIILLNIAFFAAFMWALVLITGRSAPAVAAVIVLPLIMGLVSYFTMKFRGTPLFPWDLASYGIAATVLGGYDLTIPPKVAFIISCALSLCISAFMWNIKVKFKLSKIVRPIAAAAICVLLGFGGVYIQTDKAISDFNLYPHLFTPDHLYKKNGFTVSFLMNLRYTTVEKPEGYTQEEVLAVSDEYESDSVTDATVKPNVIVIMNESFADMKALCDFETNVDYLPFINSLEGNENAVKGDLHVSVVGGNTPNSEFEFLTGMTMGYLPSGSIPYQQFLKSDRPSLASQMDDLGYHTVAMHPYWAEGWKRETVYPYLGFEEMHFLNYDTYGSFNDYHRIRDYISDKGVYDKIRLTYEEYGDGDPLFIFAVTMQNHSGYTQAYENFDPEVKVTGLEDNFSVSTYMSLVRESDSAFKGLVEYFSKADEPTVILMFGDHQPNDSIANPLMKQAGMVYSDSDLTLSEKRFTVPYVMWSNYTLDVEAPEDVSINYLSSLLMDAAGLPKTAAQKYASSLMAEFPVITGRCIIDKNGTLYPVSDYSTSKGLESYAFMQYSYLFDKDNMPVEFWTLK